MHGRGRSELNRELPLSVASKFQAGLGNVSPDMVRLSLFSQVCRRRGTFIGKSLLDLPYLLIWEMILGEKMCNSIMFQLEISIYLLSLLEGKKSLHRSR